MLLLKISNKQYFHTLNDGYFEKGDPGLMERIYEQLPVNQDDLS